MRFLRVAAVSGFLAVALGAFGAHGLTSTLAGAPDAAQRLEWWKTGASYHLAHALALGLAAVVFERTKAKAAQGAALAFVIGTVVFSGSLYAMTLTGARVLGAVTPFGGVAFLTGWAALAFVKPCE